jgi:hypothetical protein
VREPVKTVCRMRAARGFAPHARRSFFERVHGFGILFVSRNLTSPRTRQKLLRSIEFAILSTSTALREIMRGLLAALLLSILTLFGSFDNADAGSTVSVRGYTTSRGTYVAPHYRTSPNSSRIDNWSTRGNVNPFTGKSGIMILAVTATVSAQATAKEITDSECASITVQASRDAYYRTGRRCACPEDLTTNGGRCGAYYRTGRRCACPEDLTTNGGRCGGRSAYSKPGEPHLTVTLQTCQRLRLIAVKPIEASRSPLASTSKCFGPHCAALSNRARRLERGLDANRTCGSRHPYHYDVRGER